MKFLAGAMLLLLCFWYLKQNPAEKIALFSGFQIIIQKVEVFSRNLIGKNGNLIEEKYKLENDFLEIIHLAEEKGCYNAEFLDGLHQSYDNLLSEDKSNIPRYLSDYRTQMYYYYNGLSQNCEE